LSTPRRSAAGALLAALLAPMLVSCAAAPAAEPVPEPPGLWQGELVGDTPATLQGAQVLDLPALEALLAAGGPVLLLDVGPPDHRPEGLPPGTLWRPTHRSLPGAVWLPGAGRADLPPAREQALLQRVAALAQGRRDTPIVVFCKPRCWGSWNAGKRLVQAGYTGVRWFPAGVHGWQEQHETTALAPEPGWGD
jgi:PQQ-dependent catabolism-associated CXXCW motif protein